MLGSLIVSGVIIGSVLTFWLHSWTMKDWDNVPNVRDAKKSSSSITYDPVRIDFAACEPGGGTAYRSFGSDHYLIEGRKGDRCVVYVGSETENPFWDGALTTTCRVPRSTGIQEFSKVQRYCDDAQDN